MEWNISDNELIAYSDDGCVVRYTADEVWSHFQGKYLDGLPDLEEMNIRCSAKYLSPQLRLEDAKESPFGVLVLEAKSYFGKTTRLGDNHRSDHVVINGVWHPMFSEDLQELLAEVTKAGAIIGKPLNARQYLTCIRDFRAQSWFVCNYNFSAKEWTEGHVKDDNPLPSKFTAKLSDYQMRGSAWLTMMRENGIGVVLGDVMGLGKTVQVIKAICDLLETDSSAKTLIICPSALVENWVREIEKFTRGLTYIIHRGSDRSRNFRSYTASVMITSYDVARMDNAVLSLVDWDLVVLDEAQFIKNPNSRRTRAIKKITRKVAIAVTGTPFENHMTDIWSIYDFCIPDFLGNLSQFTSRYVDDERSASDLGDIIAPTMLRRRLVDVSNDLPPIITVPVPMSLEQNEAEEYERRKIAYTQQGSALGAIGNLLSDLSAPPFAKGYLSNMKYDYLDTVMQEVAGYGEKIIVFAERKQTIGALMGKYGKQFPTYVLNGSTPMNMRQQTVDEYSSVRGTAMLICNPVVGGAGLNITAANHVFHFSMQWNPAKFDQADARAHRRGQQKPVIVHYPYYVSTVEEYMWDKVALKRELAEEVVVGNKADATINEVAQALSLNPIIKA